MRILLTFCLLGAFIQAIAQPEYTMQNLTVFDCEGFLTDSELGDVPGTYDHNENYTFTICVPEADEITLVFAEFCTELGFDSLRIYDGPDTLSLQIGAYTGEPDPPVIVALSGYLTLNFISDPNVTCTGWDAQWTTSVFIPDPPVIDSIVPVVCESNEITMFFDRNVHCDSLYAAAFDISGPLFPNVTSAMPNPCVGDSTNSVVLTLDSPIDFSGLYTVIFTNYITDCEDVYILQSIGNFAVSDCPLQVQLMLDGAVGCQGDSTILVAEASGGDATSYAYQWAPIFAPDTSHIDINPFGPVTYYVTVTDAAGAMATDSLLVVPDSGPSILMNDTTLCQSLDPFVLTAFPADGEWSGNGIDEGEEESGLYDPGLVPYPMDTVYYVDPNGCEAQLYLSFIPLDEGTDDASCIGADTFTVSGGLPLGGLWSGPNITPDGIFTPSDTAGSFLVTYTHPNGCSGDKLINVDDITMPILDTLCQSEPIFEIAVTPFGGVWSGPGIVDADFGEFDASEANSGLNRLYYEINGCSDSLDIYIKEIDAWRNFNACPEQDPFIVPGDWAPMTGGTWSGNGIIDGSTGLFDPSLIPNDTRDTLFFEVDGCVDFRRVFVRQTEVLDKDTLFFCANDDELELSQDEVRVVPQDGVWSGDGITFDGDETYFFDPVLAGAGTHELTYTRNDCEDYLTVVVFELPQVLPLSFCETENAVILDAIPANGLWSGDGVINPNTGVFSPSDVGAGIYTITNEDANGCIGDGEITVDAYLEAMMTPLDETYCFVTIDIPVDVSPSGGTFTLDGDTLSNAIFNPALAGEGLHTIEYFVGQGECENSVEIITSVGAELFVSLPFETDTVCFNQNYNITAQASGGSSLGNYTYTWNQGLGFGQSQFIEANSTANYIVTAEDGCSDPALDTLLIFVHPDFTIEYDTGLPVCYSDTTFANAFAFPGNDFSFLWNSSPAVEGPFIESFPTVYTLEVTNNETGCEKEILAELPGYDLLTANFSVTPNEDCISIFDPTIQIIDLSIGATEGFWDFGDGSGLQPYIEGEQVYYTYQDTGTYTIQLILLNEGDCLERHEETVCIKSEHRLFAPNAFTPNGDGKNDIYTLAGIEIETIEWKIFNRFGEIIFVSDDIDMGWDGKFKGSRVPNGVYMLYASYTARGSAQALELKGYVTVVR